MMLAQLQGLLCKPVNLKADTALADALRVAFLEKVLADGVLAINERDALRANDDKAIN